MIEKRKVSKDEYRQVIDEILGCQNVLTKTFDQHTANVIDRLIIARIQLNQSEIDRSLSDVPKPSPLEEKKQ